MTIAETIAEQLGGRRFVAMTGAIFFSQDGGDTLLVRFKGSKKANILEVKLNGKDLYDMTFRKMRGTKLSLVETHDDIYCDQLESVFVRTTVLYTQF